MEKFDNIIAIPHKSIEDLEKDIEIIKNQISNLTSMLNQILVQLGMIKE